MNLEVKGMATEKELSQFITRDLLADREEVEVGPEDNLLLSGLVDSFGVMRLIQFIEEQYAIEVKPSEVTLKNFKTVSAICAFIAGKTNAA